MIELYVLKCPIAGEIRYAGKANNAQKRLKSHLRDSVRRNTPVYCWIRKLLDSGQLPILEVVEIVRDEEWQVRERALIASLRGQGARLLNIADGGDEPKCSTAQRVINGASVAESIHSDPTRKRLWAAKQKFSALLKSLEREMISKDFEALKLRLVAKINAVSETKEEASC